MFISTKRVLQFMEYAATHKISGCSTIEDVCERIGYRYANLNKARYGTANFTIKHIKEAVDRFNLDANWVFGVSNTMFRAKNLPLIDQLQLTVDAMRDSLTEVQKLAMEKKSIKSAMKDIV